MFYLSQDNTRVSCQRLLMRPQVQTVTVLISWWQIADSIRSCDLVVLHCVTTMGGDRSGRCRACQTVAVTLLLCSLALCLNLQVLGKKVKHEGSSETAVKDGRKGSILFNGKRLKSQSGPASSAAATGHALLQVDLHQSSITGNTWLFLLIWYARYTWGKGCCS